MKIVDIIIIKSSSSTVQARADVVFEDHTDRGFKILRDKKTGKDFVTPPSYFANGSWKPLFKTTEKSYWIELTSKIIKAYNQQLIEESLNEI